MTTKAELQGLLRFLSQDAKLPLQDAMASIKALQAAEMISPEAISKSSVEGLTKVFSSQKLARSVLIAARRVIKKRSLPSHTTSPEAQSGKRHRTSIPEGIVNPDSIVAENAFLLPTSEASVADLQSVVLQTNRAPLVLAFAIVLLSYTYPHQPLSSRLSLAQAVVSANSRSKAVSIGLESGPSAEDEGWGEGQPRIKIMGRDIRAMKRWGYELSDSNEISSTASTLEDTTNATDTSESTMAKSWTDATVPLWGLDTEALRNANRSKIAPDAAPTSPLPIFTPLAARNYLLRAFNRPEDSTRSSPAKKLSAKEAAAQKEHNAAILLKALDLLFQSWKDVLSRDELDRRAWNWYVATRPDVESGTRGWGAKGVIELKKLLDLRRIVVDGELAKQ